MPAFVNCRRYYLERFLVEHAQELQVDLRFGHRVKAVGPGQRRRPGQIETPIGDHALVCDSLLACDRARSSVRQALGLGFEGRVFEDRS